MFSSEIFKNSLFFGDIFSSLLKSDFEMKSLKPRELAEESKFKIINLMKNLLKK